MIAASSSPQKTIISVSSDASSLELELCCFALWLTIFSPTFLNNTFTYIVAEVNITMTSA